MLEYGGVPPAITQLPATPMTWQSPEPEIESCFSGLFFHPRAQRDDSSLDSFDQKTHLASSLLKSTSLSVKITASSRLLECIRMAMEPELAHQKRCTLSFRIAKRNKGLILNFSSTEIISLRASMNTNLRLIASAIRTVEAIS